MKDSIKVAIERERERLFKLASSAQVESAWHDLQSFDRDVLDVSIADLELKSSQARLMMIEQCLSVLLEKNPEIMGMEMHGFSVLKAFVHDFKHVIETIAKADKEFLSGRYSTATRKGGASHSEEAGLSGGTV